MKNRRQGNTVAENRMVRHSITSNIFFWLKTYWKWAPGIVLLSGLKLVLGTLVPLVGIYLPKLVLDLLAGDVTAMVLLRTLGIWGIMVAALYGIHGGIARGKYFVQNNVRGFVMAELFLKSLRVPYEVPQSECGKKEYQEALCVGWVGDQSASSRTFEGTLTMLQNILCFVLYSSVLSVLNPWMILVLVALSLLNVLVIEKGLRFEDRMREREAQHGRHWNYILSAMGNMTAAKDVRIFGMNSWLGGIRDRAVRDLEEDRKAYQRLNNWQYALNGLIGLVRDVAAYGYLIYSVTAGHISVSDFVLYFGAVTGFSGFVTGMLYQMGELKSARNATDYFRAYMALPEEIPEKESLADEVKKTEKESLVDEAKKTEKERLRDEAKKSDMDISSAPGIVFEDVSFAYRKEDGSAGEKILEHFNLTIAPGEKLALVGVNGAGKTTLVKLLCGLYRPDEGRILVDGRSREEMSPKEWYRLLSVVFQEQILLPLTIAENLSLQRREDTDDARAWAALKKAGLSETFARQSLTLDTYMQKKVSSKGIDLSGGQKQRLMLARALYKDAPLLVLDEPTAALDPIAESEVYESYLEHSRGKTAVFISHRLASTRFSDRIILLDHGKIVEEGTHEQLMELQGAYANMYQVQSSYYE
ncbi:MAG: ABC transporter ATP-binding protein/permease, partial [Acetatifactor sp.]|nr:ABC transporter ATP-binding protein/permease [Acetatifactor sp.]